MKNNFLLIGVDGGASKVSGWQIRINEKDDSFFPGEAHAERSYNEIPGYIADFKPVELAKQLTENSSGKIMVTDDEKQQAAVYVEACAQVIEELVEKCGQNRIAAGIGMPGLKTADKRGIAMIANGPRMEHFAGQLEERLHLRDIKFVQPIPKLGSDADYCGIGENFAGNGLFRDIKNGYYLGGGTGAADAMKLDDKLTPFDDVKTWIAKCWEMKNSDGISLERYASANGIRNIYANIAGINLVELDNQNIYPIQIAGLAEEGQKAAKDSFKLIAENLALLFYERITTLFSGWQNLFTFVDPNRQIPLKEHRFNGFLFDRIVIGQRLGELFKSQSGLTLLQKPVLKRLDQLIGESEILDNNAKIHYKRLNKIIRISNLREAPALGAGIDAYQRLNR